MEGWGLGQGRTISILVRLLRGETDLKLMESLCFFFCQQTMFGSWEKNLIYSIWPIPQVKVCSLTVSSGRQVDEEDGHHVDLDQLDVLPPVGVTHFQWHQQVSERREIWDNPLTQHSVNSCHTVSDTEITNHEKVPESWSALCPCGSESIRPHSPPLHLRKVTMTQSTIIQQPLYANRPSWLVQNRFNL